MRTTDGRPIRLLVDDGYAVLVDRWQREVSERVDGSLFVAWRMGKMSIIFHPADFGSNQTVFYPTTERREDVKAAYVADGEPLCFLSDTWLTTSPGCTVSYDWGPQLEIMA